MKKIIITCIGFIFVSNFLLAQVTGYKHIKFVTGTIVQIDPILFKTGSDEIIIDCEPTLQELKNFLQVQSFISSFRIEGHTSDKGKEADNLKLSQKRAMSVAMWLVKNGIDCKRLVAVGFGGTKPAYDNTTPEGAKNNRIELISAAIQGNLIGGEPAEGGGSSAGDVCK